MDVVWNSFVTKLEDLFLDAYKLQPPLCSLAVERVDERLQKWKQDIADTFTDTVFEEHGTFVLQDTEQETPLIEDNDFVEVAQTQEDVISQQQMVVEQEDEEEDTHPSPDDVLFLDSVATDTVNELEDSQVTTVNEEGATLVIEDGSLSNNQETIVICAEDCDQDTLVQFINANMENGLLPSSLQKVIISNTAQKPEGVTLDLAEHTHITEIIPESEAEQIYSVLKEADSMHPLGGPLHDILKPGQVHKTAICIKQEPHEDMVMNEDMDQDFRENQSPSKRQMPQRRARKTFGDEFITSLPKKRKILEVAPKIEDAEVTQDTDSDDGLKEPVGMFVCDQCPNNYNSSFALVQHKLYHQQLISCEECRKSFRTKKGYDEHMKVHKGEGFTCPQCEYVTGTKKYLQSHIKTVHTKKEHQSFLCDLCGKCYKKQSRLQRHKTEVHRTMRLTFSCPHCEYKGPTRTRLKKHMNNVHCERNLFTCDICGIGLRYKQSLLEHRSRHLGEKTLQCSFCPFTGYTNGDIKNHMVNIHSEAKEVCTVCGKKFKTAAKLRRHSVIHTGEKNFACTHCSYHCNMEGNLQKHMKNQHNIILPSRRNSVFKKNALVVDIKNEMIP